MTEYIDKTEAMRRFKPFGREIPKEQVMAVLARIEALKCEPSEDGTLEVKVEDATKIGRVLISDDEHRGGLYYPDEDEPQGDLISRAEAIEAIELVDWYHQNSNKDMVHGANDDEHQAWYKADDVYKALEAVPSADRPMVIKCEPFLSEEDFKAFAEQASDQNVILISNEAEVVSTNTSTNTSTKSTNISIDAPADRPRGEWILLTERMPETDGEYLCSYGKHIHIGQMINGHFRHYGEVADHLITAWMPLPEPYKESDTK